MNKAHWIVWVAAVTAVGATAGCHNPPPPKQIHGEVFVPDQDVRAVQNITTAQVAAGDRADATLYPAHFNDAGLNSLGRQKLDLMLADEDEPAEPLVVYLDLPADAPRARAHKSVLAYLNTRGLPESQVHLEDGPNPRVTSSADDTVTALHAMEAPAQGGAPGAPAPTNSAGNNMQAPPINH